MVPRPPTEVRLYFAPDEILAHDFLNPNGTIPKTLPNALLACPPSATYIRQFIPNGISYSSKGFPQRLESTAPANPLQGQRPGQTGTATGSSR